MPNRSINVWWRQLVNPPSNIESATDDQTGAEIVTAIDTELGSSDWQSGGGGGVYSILKAKGNIAGVSFANVENILAWTSSFNTGADVTLGANTVTIDEDGTYKFTVTLRTDSNNRTELFIRTYIDTGSGLVQDTDEIVSDYVSRDTDQNTGAVTLATALQLTAGDVVQFRGFGDTDGTCIGLNAGTALLVERVA